MNLSNLYYQDKKFGNWNEKTEKYDKPKDEWEGTDRNQKEIESAYEAFKKANPYSKLTDEISYVLVDLIDYDWYNNEGGQGCVVWNLKHGEIFVDGEQNVYAHNTVKETYYTDGKEPEYDYNDEVFKN